MDSSKVVAVLLLVTGILILSYTGYSLLQKGERVTAAPSTQPLPKSETGTTRTTTTTKTSTTSSESKPKETTSTRTTPTEITSTTPETKPTGTTSTGTETSETIQPKYETGFFRHRWLKYRVRAGGEEFVYTFENLGEETLDGRACYHQRIKVEDSQSAEMEEWYDKRTFECVKIVVSIPGIGRGEVPCPPRGTVTTTQGKTNASQAQVPVQGEQMRYVGEEMIKVPAGTFDCFVFEGDGTKVWIAKQGLLVKWTSKDAEGVLLGYG